MTKPSSPETLLNEEQKALTVTEADRKALSACPEGWFDHYHDSVFLLRCPEFRLERLAERGLLEWKVEGELRNLQRLYRLTRKGREIKSS